MADEQVPNIATAAGFGQGESSPGMLVAIIFLVAILVFVVIYLIMKYSLNQLKYTTAMSYPFNLKGKGHSVLAAAEQLPSLTNGRTYSYSCWLYVQEVEAGKQKIVLYRGSASQPNPLIYMDANENKLNIRLRTIYADARSVALPAAVTAADTGNAANTNLITGRIIGKDMDKEPAITLMDKASQCYYLDIPIQYVPLERWVHVVVAVDFDTVVVYVDGEIYHVESVTTTTYRDVNNAPCRPSGLSTTSGDIVTGVTESERTSAGLDTANAVISRLAFFNYPLTLAQVRKVYEKGPFNQGLLAKLGLPMYGVRNPFFRVDGSTDTPDS